MKLSYVRSDAIYKKIMEAPVEKKNDIYRYELMMPFKGKWDCYQIPMKAATPNGYDIIMASDMLGLISPTKVDQSQKANIESLSSDWLWDSCEQSIRKSLECFLNNGIELPVSEYLFTVLLANAESHYISLNEGYCGDGGIPGYIMAWLIPNEFTLTRLPVALAHEVNHNVRFQFIKWRNSITLLKPTMVTDSKYRLYTDDDLSRLQEILFFREVGFALKEIKSLLASPNYDRTEALTRHLDILQAQKERIDALISLIKTEIEGNHVSSFAPFSDTKVLELKEKYRSEVLERWGDTHSFKEYEAAFLSQPKEGQRNQLERFLSVSKDTFEKLARFQNQSPACQEVQQIVKEWQQYISESFYKCDNQILLYLGQLYISDDRFSNYINGFGSGNLASFFTATCGSPSPSTAARPSTASA